MQLIEYPLLMTTLEENMNRAEDCFWERDVWMMWINANEDKDLKDDNHLVGLWGQIICAGCGGILNKRTWLPSTGISWENSRHAGRQYGCWSSRPNSNDTQAKTFNPTWNWLAVVWPLTKTSCGKIGRWLPASRTHILSILSGSCGREGGSWVYAPDRGGDK